MKTFAVSLGAFALNFLLAVLILVVVAVVLWIAVPVAFPALGFTFTQAVGVSALLYLLKTIYS